MGSLWMKRSDMDGDNASPFSTRKIDQIKKILHRDVDKELEQAIKIAKEINSRIYQVHRNILVYQKLNPSRKVAFNKSKTTERTCSNDDESREGSSSERSCDSSKLEDLLQHVKTKPTNRACRSNKCILDQKLSESSQNQSNSESQDKNESNWQGSKLITRDSNVPCSKCLSPNKGNCLNSNETERNSLSQDSPEKNIHKIGSQSSISDSRLSEGVDDKCAEIASSVWLVCLDHDYLKENAWGEQIKRRKRSHSSSTEKQEVLIKDAQCSSSDDSSPACKKIKTESSSSTKSSLPTSELISASSLASSDSLLSGIKVNDVKYDDFLSSSLYFDNDLMIFDQNPFSHNNIDLSSICDIPSLNFDDECSMQTNRAVSSSELGKDNISNYNSCNLSADPLKKLTNNNVGNTLNGASPLKLRFTIGTVSKLLLASEKSCHETHIWKIYVRNTFAEDMPLDNYIAKIRFLIHDSYAPNNLIERKEPPYEITRRGWGEFPIRVQIFFRFNKKPICLVHQLSLVRNVINILTLGVQKNYEIVIPNLANSFQPSKETEANRGSGTHNNGQWKNAKSDPVVKNMFDFKIKEIDTVAKINELISQNTVPNANDNIKSDNVYTINSWSMLPFKELKTQLLEKGDFFTNFSDLNQIKTLTSSIKNYCERILFLLDILPIITPHANLKWYKQIFPYSCPSKSVFESWPIGKQRASEFSRARMIKSLATLDSAEDWSTNEIVLFARSKDDNFENDPVSKASLVTFAKSVALQQLIELENQLAEAESNEIINIV